MLQVPAIDWHVPSDHVVVCVSCNHGALDVGHSYCHTVRNALDTVESQPSKVQF